MKKILVMMIIAVLSIVLLTGCGNNSGKIDDDSSLDSVEENTESIAEDTSMATEAATLDGENSVASEEESEPVEETVMHSAEEVMEHTDALIEEYTYNNPEHIKALVIAANLDYITEEDLNTILTTYGYTMEELGVLYDECILDNGNANITSFDYYQGNIESLPEDKDYENRISINKIMLNSEDANLAQWYDSLLYGLSQAKSNNQQCEEFVERIQNCSNEMSYAERTMYSYSCGIYANSLIYTDYLESPYTYYINSNL